MTENGNFLPSINYTISKFNRQQMHLRRSLGCLVEGDATKNFNLKSSFDTDKEYLCADQGK